MAWEDPSVLVPVANIEEIAERAISVSLRLHAIVLVGFKIWFVYLQHEFTIIEESTVHGYSTKENVFCVNARGDDRHTGSIFFQNRCLRGHEDVTERKRVCICNLVAEQ